MGAITLINLHEGCKLKAYRDNNKGVWTAGWGTNLQELVIDQATADKWRDQKIAANAVELQRITAYAALDAARQAAIQDMAYEMGVAGCLAFHDMWKALTVGNWQAAHDAALNSPWAQKEAPARAEQDARILLTGAWPV